MINPLNKETTEFSLDKEDLDKKIISTKNSSDLDALSFEEYCKRDPSASECREYDV